MAGEASGSAALHHGIGLVSWKKNLENGQGGEERDVLVLLRHSVVLQGAGREREGEQPAPCSRSSELFLQGLLRSKFSSS